MLVKSITEEEIYGIGHASGYYDYGEETGNVRCLFPGKKHKRSKAYSRFLLQMRLFCQKTCKTYDFVLLFQFENAKTEISITHRLRRISSASADFCCAAKVYPTASMARSFVCRRLFYGKKGGFHGLIRQKQGSISAAGRRWRAPSGGHCWAGRQRWQRPSRLPGRRCTLPPSPIPTAIPCAF